MNSKKLKIFFILGFSVLYFIGVYVSGVCYAQGMIENRLTIGPDEYLENSTNLSFDIIDTLYSSVNYSFSEDKNSEEPNKIYLVSLGNYFSDTFSSELNYTISPDINGYKYDTIGVNISLGDLRGGRYNNDFQTTLFVDFSQTNHSADVYIDTTTVLRKIHIDTTWKLEQNSWTFGLTETFYRNTELIFNYTSFSYNKDLKDPLFQRVLDFVIVLGGFSNTKLPGVLFSISSFPLCSYNVGLIQYFSDYFSLSFDYTRLINYVDNSMVFYYSSEAGLVLNKNWRLEGGYTLYIDELKDHYNYYSLGVGFTF